MYIRTKDGRIIDTTKYPEHPESWSVQASDYALTIKQSENLEELCDEFVIVSRKDYEKNFIAYGLDREFLYESVIEHYRNCKCCYGAIWTSKGLIYVAKMNEKGVLELI